MPSAANYKDTSAEEFRRKHVSDPQNLVGAFAKNKNASFLSHMTASTAPLNDSATTFDSVFSNGSGARIVSPENRQHRSESEYSCSENERRAARNIFVSRYRKFQHASPPKNNVNTYNDGYAQGIEQCGTMNTLGTIYSSEFDSAWKGRGSPSSNEIEEDEFELMMKPIGTSSNSSYSNNDHPDRYNTPRSFPRVVSSGDRSLNSLELRRLPLHVHERSISSRGENDLLLIEEDVCLDDEPVADFGEI